MKKKLLIVIMTGFLAIPTFSTPAKADVDEMQFVINKIGRGIASVWASLWNINSNCPGALENFRRYDKNLRDFMAQSEFDLDERDFLAMSRNKAARALNLEHNCYREVSMVSIDHARMENRRQELEDRIIKALED